MVSLRSILFTSALVGASALAGCGGSGAAVGAPNITVGSSGSGAGPGSGAGSGTGASPSPSPKPGSTVAPSPTPAATSTGTSAQSTIAAPTAPPDDPAHTNVVPAVPASGCRAGQTYNVYVDSAPTDISPTGTLEAFTVFEPTSLCAGQTYPLIFNGPGFGGSRTSAVGSFASFNNAGYGVISVDEAGEGEDGGKIRVMDPDQEGVMLLAVMNWAQAKLAWLSYGPTNDGSDPHEPVFGSEGGSYGGMYQFMLLNVDKRHRLRAIVPQITPADLNFSLFQNGAIKTLWDAVLFGDGQSAGSGTSRANFDPYVNNGFASDFAANAEDAGFHDFFGYHSADYFCNGAPIATNGGAGTAPYLPPASGPPKINALIWIGVRDTLFNYDNGYNNFKCLQRGGGDVRLLSYQTGHNAQVVNNVPAGVVPDPSVALFYPANDSLDARCGLLKESDAELAWFNTYLKGQTGAISAIPTNPCISLSAGDGVTVPQISTYASGPAETAYPISTTVVAGVTPDAGTQAIPNVITLSTAGASGDVEAGVPHVVFDIAPVGGVAANVPTVYVGLGVLHTSNTAVYDLVDNQVTPLVGTGHFDLDLIGGGVRLLPGDQLALLIFGYSTQYAGTGSVNVTKPVPQAVTVTGKVYVPDLGPMPANI